MNSRLSEAPAFYWQLPSGGDFNIEYLFNPETDRFNRHGLKVDCPGCGRENTPLLSPHTKVEKSDMRWVGLDHREPFTDYSARCPGCGEPYQFTTYIPQ